MDYYDLTNPQKSIWSMEEFYKGSNINNICGTLTIKEEVDLDRLNKAVNIFIQNNKSFGLRIVEKNGEIKQYFTKEEYLELERVNLKDKKALDAFALDTCEHVFDIYGNRLYKFILFKLDNGYGGFVILTHHLISDAATFGLIGTEIADIYSKLDINEEIVTKDYSYEDYIEAEKEYMESPKFLKAKEYWEGIYESIPEVASIPSSYKKEDNVTFGIKAKREDFLIDTELLRKITAFCTKYKLSSFNFFMAIFGIYISKITNLTDFCIGTPILNRTGFKEKHTSGMFINIAALRIKLDEDISFIDFAKDIAESSLGMLRYQKYPYDMLLENLRKKDNHLPNLYDVMLSYQITKAHDKESSLPYEVKWYPTSSISTGLTIHLHDNNDEESLNIAYDYKIDKYDERDVKDLHARVVHLINQVLENEDILEKDLEIVTEEEKDKILNEFNNTVLDYPKDKTVSQLFEEQVAKNPKKVALFFDGKILTYEELNKKANSLANHLISQGIKKGDIVCLFFDKSLEMIVSIISVLKIGACYLPIDINYPIDRINYIIEDSRSKILLTTEDIKEATPSNISSIYVDLDGTEIYKCSSNNLNLTNLSPDDNSYIMYTSGSTGRPKGVVVKNLNIVRLVKNPNFIKFSECERILQTGSIVFDACTFEIWSALLNGFELYIIKKEELLDASLLKDYLSNNKITILWLTAPLFNQLCEEDPYIFNSVKYLLTGGDVLSPKHIGIAKNANPNLTVINGYGPTENTTFSTCFTINNIPKQGESIPIGRPISGSTAYVVSRSGTLLPIGFTGELWVGGDGVSKGYLNNPELTKDKFVKNPFGEGTLYKTGDAVSLLPDGNINFIRKD